MFQALYGGSDPSFKHMYNIIYIDEKWFYRTRHNQKYYLANNEERPHREVKSKNFIEKVMFLAIVARPRFDQNGNCIFDGKLGVFPFVYVEPAKRRSENRPRGMKFVCLHIFIQIVIFTSCMCLNCLLAVGTLITKAMTYVTKATSREFLINKVLPAIKAKWPAEERHLPIFIIDVNYSEFVAAAQCDAWERVTVRAMNEA